MYLRGNVLSRSPLKVEEVSGCQAVESVPLPSHYHPADHLDRNVNEQVVELRAIE